jgi:lysophospholipase L1-like esterase
MSNSKIAAMLLVPCILVLSLSLSSLFLSQVPPIMMWGFSGMLLVLIVAWKYYARIFVGQVLESITQEGIDETTNRFAFKATACYIALMLTLIATMFLSTCESVPVQVFASLFAAWWIKKEIFALAVCFASTRLGKPRSATSVLGLLLSCWFLILFSDRSEAQGTLPEAHRILFLGDSITHSGGYIASLETAMIATAPDQPIELLNLGLPSETVSGLTEPGHAGGQFPRPDLHERLQRVLDQTKPDLVIACYGMNDGIYYPLSDDRFMKFRNGMERLHQAVVDRGAKIIHLTPAYFDAMPIRDRLLPAGKEAYPQPYEGYDDVLEAYSAWLMKKRKDGWEVIDVHGAMKDAVLSSRKKDPAFTFASDGVHPNAAGQVVITGPLAKAWGLSLNDKGLPEHPHAEEIYRRVAEKQNLQKLAWLSATGHLRPGIAAGKSLEEANKLASELDTKARELAKSK